MARARRITKRNAIYAISMTFSRADILEVFPAGWFEDGGREPFTWSLRSLLNALRGCHQIDGKRESVEYVLDYLSPHDPKRAEVEMMFAQFENVYSGEYEGKWSFRSRTDVPGLQCVDQLAWAAHT
jgi:hypothetical protein